MIKQIRWQAKSSHSSLASRAERALLNPEPMMPQITVEAVSTL
jgi:hypothetical protein